MIDREKRKLAHERRLARVARRMETLRAIAEKAGEEVGSGDPFAVELAANLQRIESGRDRWGNKNRSASTRVRKFRNGFQPPKSWKSGQQQGISVLDKALMFMSVFQQYGIGYRQLHILIMVTGECPLSIQQAADVCGLTFYGVRQAMRKMENEGFIKINQTKRVGGQSPLVSVQLTARGAGVMRALNRFNPNKIDSYDRAVAMGTPRIPTDLRLLRIRDIIDDANNIAQDI